MFTTACGALYNVIYAYLTTVMFYFIDLVSVYKTV